jgi:hypothetical protein
MSNYEPFPLDGGRAGMGVNGAHDAIEGPQGSSSASNPQCGVSTPTPGLSPIEGERRL